MNFQFKNEFEYDWCACALSPIKKHLCSLKGSRWIFFAPKDDTLSSAVLRFLHFADQQLQLQLSFTVLVHGDGLSLAQDLFPFAKIIALQAQTPLQDAEYTFCNSYGTDMHEFDLFCKQIARPTRCSILTADAKSCTSLTHESITCRTVILQLDALLAPSLQLASLISEQRKFHLCYITDFLTALILTAANGDCFGTYRVAAWESDELNPDQLFSHPDEVGLIEFNPAVCAQPLRELGWTPLVDLPTMAMLECQSRNTDSGLLWLPGGHDGKLPAIQTLLFRILCEVKRICDKHQIRYFLGGGTLLGAVRHQGFIPWDDDLDIMMLRKDYDRFITIAQQELPNELFLQTPKTEAGNHYLISKIRLKNTVFCSEFLMRFPQLENGIFVDIIAQDYTANSRLGQKLHLKLSLLARGLVFKKWSGESATVKKKAYAFFDPIKKFLPFRFLEWFQHRVLTLFSNASNRRYLYDSMGINITKGSYPAEWLSASVDVMFHGENFPAPIEYDAYLRYLYGDYMRPVPISARRVVHSVPWIDLGPYSQEPNKPFHYR